MPPFLTLLQFHDGLNSDLGCIDLTIADRWCKLIVTVICIKHSTLPTALVREICHAHRDGEATPPSSAYLPPLIAGRVGPAVLPWWPRVPSTSFIQSMECSRSQEQIDLGSRYFCSHDLRFQIFICRQSEILIYA